MILAGIFALIFPVLSSVAVVVFLGWLAADPAIETPTARAAEFLLSI
jgi:hypothetical protein